MPALGSIIFKDIRLNGKIFKGGSQVMANEKSKERLKAAMAEEITKMFESVLDYVQVACPTPDTYKVLRSKILRVGNNCIRAAKKELMIMM